MPAIHNPMQSASADSTPVSPVTLRDWVTLLRPRQWSKNLVVFAGLLFTARFTQPTQVLQVVAVCAIFCALSSCGYIVNDVLDRQSDRAHPVKCRRPLASGRVRPVGAIALAVLLLAGSLGGAVGLGWGIAGVSMAYLAVTLGYSLVLKHQVIMDLMAIAGGFLLRALAGTVALGVVLSPWLFACVSFLALLLGFGKRYHEMTMLGEEAIKHRPVLAQYDTAFVNQLMGMMAASSIITYTIYAISSPTAVEHPALVFTVPFVLYAVIRYLYLAQHGGRGGQPEEIFLTDRPMLCSVLLWGLAVIVIFLCGSR